MLAKLETLIEFSRKVLLASRESIQWTRIGAALEAFANAERDRRYLVECARLMLAAREENEPLRNLLSAEEWQALKVAAKSKRYALTYMNTSLAWQRFHILDALFGSDTPDLALARSLERRYFDPSQSLIYKTVSPDKQGELAIWADVVAKDIALFEGRPHSNAQKHKNKLAEIKKAWKMMRPETLSASLNDYFDATLRQWSLLSKLQDYIVKLRSAQASQEESQRNALQTAQQVPPKPDELSKSQEPSAEQSASALETKSRKRKASDTSAQRRVRARLDEEAEAEAQAKETLQASASEPTTSAGPRVQKDAVDSLVVFEAAADDILVKSKAADLPQEHPDPNSQPTPSNTTPQDHSQSTQSTQTTLEYCDYEDERSSIGLVNSTTPVEEHIRGLSENEAVNVSYAAQNALGSTSASNDVLQENSLDVTADPIEQTPRSQRTQVARPTDISGIPALECSQSMISHPEDLLPNLPPSYESHSFPPIPQQDANHFEVTFKIPVGSQPPDRLQANVYFDYQSNSQSSSNTSATTNSQEAQPRILSKKLFVPSFLQDKKDYCQTQSSPDVRMRPVRPISHSRSMPEIAPHSTTPLGHGLQVHGPVLSQRTESSIDPTLSTPPPGQPTPIAPPSEPTPPDTLPSAEQPACFQQPRISGDSSTQTESSGQSRPLEEEVSDFLTQAEEIARFPPLTSADHSYADEAEEQSQFLETQFYDATASFTDLSNSQDSQKALNQTAFGSQGPSHAEHRLRRSLDMTTSSIARELETQVNSERAHGMFH